MGTDIEKLVDLMIQERMQSQFAKWREAETGKEKKADYLRLETEYQKAVSALSEEQKDAVKNYCDSIFDSGAESECFFYRLGLKDGIRLWKFMKKLMKLSEDFLCFSFIFFSLSVFSGMFPELSGVFWKVSGVLRNFCSANVA